MTEYLSSFSPYLKYVGGELHVEGVSMQYLAQELGTPLYVYSASHVRERMRAYREAFPDALLCYAVKANANPALLQLLQEEGAGADIVSGGELYIARLAGIPPAKIVYAGVGKTPQELAYALHSDILLFNVESRMELDLLSELAQSFKCTARVAIRVNPDISLQTHPYIATGMRTSKFGIDIRSAREEYVYARRLPGIEVVGIHYHIGSQIMEPAPFVEATERVLELYRALQYLGFAIRYLNIGGGLGIPYEPNQPSPEPKALAEALAPLLGGIEAQLILEPGRSIVGNAGTLLTQVQFRKHNGYKSFIIVDAGMNDLVPPAMYEAYHHILPVVHTGAPEEKVDIVGPVCESGDFLALDRVLPRVEREEYLAVLSAGAYGATMSSHYNLRPRAREVLVEGQHYQVIREREQYADLFSPALYPTLRAKATVE